MRIILKGNKAVVVDQNKSQKICPNADVFDSRECV